MMRSKFVLVYSLFALVATVNGQDYTNKWYLKIGGNYGQGITPVSAEQSFKDTTGVEFGLYGITIFPGSALAPVLSVGKVLYHNLTGQVTLLYNLNYNYENVNGFVTASGFSRFGVFVEANYFVGIKQDIWAIVPTVGIGYMMPNDLFYEFPTGYRQTISYGDNIGIRIAAEFQRNVNDKFSFGFGPYFFMESYTAEETKIGDVNELDGSLKNLNASSIGFQAQVTIPLVQNTKMGHMRNMFK